MGVLNHIVRRFDSVAECVLHSENVSSKTKQSHSPAQKWNGDLTFEEAAKLAIDGWSEMRPMIDEILVPVRTILSDTLSNIPERVLDIVGAEPDMDRFFAGDIENMWDVLSVPQETRVFNILCNNDASGVVSPQTIANRGAAIAAIVEAFAIMGCEVNVWAEICSRGRNWSGYHSVLVNVHSAGTYLDINNIMFPLAHPAWLRRIMFGLFEGETAAVKNDFFDHHTGGYGAVAQPQCAEMVDASIVMSASQRYKADHDPVGWVMDQLRLQGVIPS